MDTGHVPVLDRLLQAAQDHRRAAANAYMVALAQSVIVGECAETVEHEHRQFYLRGLDMIGGEVEL